MAGTFRFTFGPWNIHEGADPFGPDVREPLTFDQKLPLFKKLGFDGVQFHDDDAVPEINGKTPAQIILRWHTQMGFVVIPGSRNVAHIRDNLDILDFTLTDAEMAEIAALDKGVRYYNRTDAQLVQFAAWQPTYERK